MTNSGIDVANNSNAIASKDFLDNLPIGFFYISNNLEILSVNSAALHILDTSEESILNTYLLDMLNHYLPPDVSSQMIPKFKASFQNIVEKRDDFWLNNQINYKIIVNNIPLMISSRSILYGDSFGIFIEDITDNYNQSGQNLLVEEKKFLSIFFNSPIPTLIVDLTTNTIYEMNSAFADEYGWNRKKLIGSSIKDMKLWVSIDDRDRFLHELFSVGSVKNFSSQFYDAKGEVIIGQLSSAAVTINGRRCAVHFFADLTDVYRERQDLLRSKSDLTDTLKENYAKLSSVTNSLKNHEDEYRSLTERMPVGIYRTSYSGQFIQANPAMAKILGYDSAEEVLHTNAINLYEDSNERIVKFFNDKFLNTIINEETRIIRRDGSFGWVNDYATLSYDKNHKYVLDGVLQDITEQVRIRQALQESEEKYRLLFENLTDIFISLSPQGEITNLSPSFCKISGCDTKLLLMQKVDSILADDPINTYFLKNFSKIKVQTNYNIVFKHAGKDKSYHSLNLQPLTSATTGEIFAFEGIARDITTEVSHNRVMTTLYDISRACNNADNLIELYTYIHKALGNIIDATNFYIAIVDYKKEIITFPYIVDEMDTENASIPYNTKNSFTAKVISGRKAILRHYNDERFKNIETTGTISKVWLGVPLQMKDKVIGAIVVQSYTDPDLYSEKDIDLLQSVSDQIALAIDRKDAQVKTAENMQFLNNILDNIPYGIYYKDIITGKYSLCNKAFSATLGMSRNNIIGKNSHDLYLKDRADKYDNYDIAIKTNPKRIQKFDETRIDYHGNDLYSTYVRSCTFDSNGEPNGIIGVVLDITEQKKAETKIFKALQKEIELNELKNKFISMVSHEYRTPLQAISLAAELLENYYTNLTPENREKQFMKIKNSIFTLNSMLDDVLLLNRKERGLLRFLPEKTDLAASIKSQVRELQFVAKNGIMLNLDIKSTTATQCFIVDEKLLHLVMQNLINNASKYSKENTVVQIVVRISEERLIADITDTGIGIPKQDQELLFTAFFRAGNVGTISGTGLGLSLVKEAIELMHGQINFTSIENEGTTFHFEIPFPPQQID